MNGIDVGGGGGRGGRRARTPAGIHFVGRAKESKGFSQTERSGEKRSPNRSKPRDSHPREPPNRPSSPSPPLPDHSTYQTPQSPSRRPRSPKRGGRVRTPRGRSCAMDAGLSRGGDESSSVHEKAGSGQRQRTRVREEDRRRPYKRAEDDLHDSKDENDDSDPPVRRIKVLSRSAALGRLRCAH